MENKNENSLIFDELLTEESARVRYEIRGGSLGQYTKRYETWKRSQNIIRYLREETRLAHFPVCVADIGCGHGLCVWMLSSLFGSRQIEFHGVDISDSRIYLARRLQKRFGLENVSFSIANAVDTKLPDGWADIVLCAEVIEHIAEPEKCLAEMLRILKPGGAAIVTTPNGSNQICALRSIFNPFYTQPEQEALEPEKQPPAEFHRHVSIKGLRDWHRVFKRSGFIVERIRRGSLFCGGEKYDRFPLLFGISLFLDAVLDLMPFTGNLTENLAFKLRKPQRDKDER